MPPPGISPEVFKRLDLIADAVNPALLLWALLLLARRARESRRAGEPFSPWQVLGAWLLAIAAVYVAAELNGWLKIWPGPHPKPYRFPSGHTAFAVCLATLGATLDRRSLALTIPLLALYGVLIILLGYHVWIDIVGAAVLAPIVTLGVLQVLKRRRARARIQ